MSPVIPLFLVSSGSNWYPKQQLNQFACKPKMGHNVTSLHKKRNMGCQECPKVQDDPRISSEDLKLKAFQDCKCIHTKGAS